MPSNVSPGVFTKITDLSAYISQVPTTIGFMSILSPKGEDNTLKFVSSRSEFITEFGEPNINDYGKNYSQGPYCAYNYLGESGALYVIRCCSDDAAYANIRISAIMAAPDSSAVIGIDSVQSLNSLAELKTSLETSGSTYPIAIIYPIGRGSYYNGLSIRLSEHSNPVLVGIYVLDLYEKQSDGDDVIIESFEISFNDMATDLSSDSIFIPYVLSAYSTVLRAEMTRTNGELSSGFYLTSKVYDQNLGTVTAVETPASLSDQKQDFSDWEQGALTRDYTITAVDSRGNKIWGWCGAASGTYNETIEIWNSRFVGDGGRSWIGLIGSGEFDISDTSIDYQIKRSEVNISSGFISSDPVPLRYGSDGLLVNSDGSVDTSEATNLLASGYAGLIDDQVLDTENIYFSLVFDCGYPTDVKSQISTLVQTRRDCVAILDNGDNSTVNAAIQKRKINHTFNNYFCALYEPYNKVYDIFTGSDIWFSPVYHMSYIIPRNDRTAEVWFAAAGFNRAAIDTIKEMRFVANLGQRDQLYLRQINPIAKFNEGYTVWGNLTTQARSTKMQNLNVVRLVLYCQRAIEQFCRFFIFEQNDTITWSQVSGNISQFLEDIKARRGLYSYSVEAAATDYEIKRKQFHVNVRLSPIVPVEQILLNFFIE